MESTEHHIEYQTTGRYFTAGELTDGKKLIIALHGYGYLPQYFIRKFDTLDLNEYVVVCPEGPHKYYHSGNNGRVGASWMTKEDRLTDIKNYITFLDTLLDKLKSSVNFESITLLGFSQGGATASRWVAFGKHKFDKFLLWATVFPPDMEKEYSSKFLSSSNYFIFGTKDEYYSENQVHEHFHELSKLNIPFEMRKFDGAHEIHQVTLQSVLDE